MLTLDKMQIQGFKSFYGRTELDFCRGITAVVGPNGCGKSNIGDAISWVLGDQSPRSLRADRMEDVIFNGSEARRPMGMAEVTLRFLGSNGGPEPAEELVVSRRLYRNGESEYSMNGSRCRLHDIQEALVRSQVGSHVYSVIEQGKVDLILSARPKERRTLFEEAAGILGYKSKRRIAEGKLESTQANLLRIQDILVEVERQTGSLRRQVAKARRYRRLQDRILQRRSALLRARLVDLERAKEASDEDRRLESDRESGLSTGLARYEAKVESLRRSFEEAEGEARTGRRRLNDLDREIDRDRLLRQNGLEQAAEARRARERWSREAEEVDRRLKERNARQAERSVLLTHGQENLGGLETALEEVEAEHRARLEAARRQEDASEARRADLLAALDHLAECRSRGRGVEEDLRRLAEKRRSLDREIEASRKDLEERRVEREETGILVSSRESESDRAREERLSIETSLAAEDAALQSLAVEKEILTGKLARSEERLRALEEEERSSQEAGWGVQAILSRAAEGKIQIRGRLADALEVDPEWVVAAETALRDLLGAVVVDEAEQALAGVRYLKEGARGRCGFLSLDDSGTPQRRAPASLLSDARCAGLLSARTRTGVEVRGALRACLESTLLVSDLSDAVELSRLHPGWTYVTADGDLLDSRGWIHGGARGPGEAGFLSRRRERDEQEGLRLTARNDRDRLEAEGERRLESRARLTELLAALEERARDLERAVVEARFRLARLEEESGRTSRALGLAEEELGMLDEEERGLVEERDRLAQALSAAEDGRRGLEAEIAVTAGRLAAVREEVAAGAEAIGTLRAQVTAEREKVASAEQERTAWEESAREERERLALAESEARAAEGRVAEWEGRIAALSEGLERGQSERGLLSASLEAVETKVSSVRSELLEAEKEGKTARGELDALRGKISESEIVAAKLGVEFQHLEASCLQELSMGLDALRALPAPEGESPREALETEMADLKGRLERLGAVNLAALEQYAEMEERLAFLSRQKRDLEEAIESLRDTIRRINRTSRDRFLEAFEWIQQEFNRSFQILFEGGAAELRLMEGEDVLECGIEITASPPGKRLQSISLLSGGEKAMAAVALLFAIFRYRPSPFCLLDEVDAPLDEANVLRFTRMLKGMAPETQFILITHNRRSMEAADLLYGITMEEPGISKVVSMRLEN